MSEEPIWKRIPIRTRLLTYEKELNRLLRAQLDKVEPGLVAIDNGREREVPSGRIDIPRGTAMGILSLLSLRSVPVRRALWNKCSAIRPILKRKRAGCVGRFLSRRPSQRGSARLQSGRMMSTLSPIKWSQCRHQNRLSGQNPILRAVKGRGLINQKVRVLEIQIESI